MIGMWLYRRTMHRPPRVSDILRLPDSPEWCVVVSASPLVLRYQSGEQVTLTSPPRVERVRLLGVAAPRRTRTLRGDDFVFDPPREDTSDVCVDHKLSILGECKDSVLILRT